MTFSIDACCKMKSVNIYPTPNPPMIPKRVKMIFSRTMYIVTSLSKNPRTFIVDNSRTRSEILILVRLYKTIKASSPDNTTKIKTTESKFAIDSSCVSICLDMKDVFVTASVASSFSESISSSFVVILSVRSKNALSIID